MGNFKNAYNELQIKEIVENRGYILLGIRKEKREYNSKRRFRNITIINLKCKCGNEFEISLNNFKNHNQGCPECARKRTNDSRRLAYEYVKKEIEKEGYELLSNNYINNREKLIIQCNNGHKYEARYNDFQSGYRCPYCNESKGEKEISRILDELKVDYIYNMGYFKDLKCNKKPLRPDFIIEDKKIWIEYDGIQHYQYGKFNGDLLDLMNIKYRDKLKDDYAIKNGWKLIRILYWDFENIEKILINEFLRNE